MANVCTVANIDIHGRPQMRTLVLRDAQDDLAIFINATSPKWAMLQDSFTVLTYWPSLQLQYRMQTLGEPLAEDFVHASWQLRPDAPKTMDWFYEQGNPQSSSIDSREALLKELARMELPAPLNAPASARGLRLVPQEIERLDLNQPNGIHERVLFTRRDAGWHSTHLIP